MRRIHLAALALWPVLLACKAPETTLILNPATPPVSATVPAVPSSPTTPRPTLPGGIDLYAQFAQPFPASATRRLQEIQVFIDSTQVASSIFTYNPVGLLESRRYLEVGSSREPTVRYTYDSQKRLRSEATSELRNPLDASSAYITRVLDYRYAGDQLVTLTQKTPDPGYSSFASPTLSAYTSFQYPGQAVREAVRVGYQCNVCGVNLTVSVDSTRRRIATVNRLTTSLDSSWRINRPYNGPVSASFSRVLVDETTRDDKENALSIRTTTTSYSTQFTQTTTREQAFTHQYDGFDGLISRSFYPAYKLRYEFVYEPK